MSIYALEGPDGCGKSTLYDALYTALVGYRFVKMPAMSPSLFGHMAELQYRETELWRMLYHLNQKYICDRHPAVSAPVYDQVFNRSPRLDIEYWYPTVIPVYIQVPLATLKGRCESRGDAHICPSNLKLLVAAYKDHISKFDKCIILDGMAPTNVMVNQFMREVQRCV